MKNLISAMLFSLIGSSVSAQLGINSFSIMPVNPTPQDTIKVYASCSFSSGGCDLQTSSVMQNGSTFDATAEHCLGMLGMICSTTDSFIIQPLPSGIYTFKLTLMAGAATSVPCTPSTVDVDSISFTVGGITGVSQPALSENLPCSYTDGKLYFQTKTKGTQTVRIFNTAGQLVLDERTTEQEIALPLSAGIYFITVSDERKVQKGKFMIP